MGAPYSAAINEPWSVHQRSIRGRRSRGSTGAVEAALDLVLAVRKV
jgi:hypothetical protein